MKTLFICRHAKSDWADIGQRDFDRPLDERGHRDAPRMAKLLRGLGIAPDLLVSSPALRARTTAQYFAAEFGIQDAAIDLQLDIYDASEHDILHIVHQLPDAANVVFLFGHNPTLTYFVNRFSKEIIDNLPTCGVVRLDVSVNDWASFSEKTVRNDGFWFPKMLK